MIGCMTVALAERMGLGWWGCTTAGCGLTYDLCVQTRNVLDSAYAFDDLLRHGVDGGFHLGDRVV